MSLLPALVSVTCASLQFMGHKWLISLCLWVPPCPCLPELRNSGSRHRSSICVLCSCILPVTLFVAQQGDPAAGLCWWWMVLSCAITSSAAACAVPCLPRGCWGLLAGPRYQ